MMTIKLSHARLTPIIHAIQDALSAKAGARQHQMIGCKLTLEKFRVDRKQNIISDFFDEKALPVERSVLAEMRLCTLPVQPQFKLISFPRRLQVLRQFRRLDRRKRARNISNLNRMSLRINSDICSNSQNGRG